MVAVVYLCARNSIWLILILAVELINCLIRVLMSAILNKDIKLKANHSTAALNKQTFTLIGKLKVESRRFNYLIKKHCSNLIIYYLKSDKS